MKKKTDVMIECKFCQAFYTVPVDENAYKDWQNGEGFIQDLMPELSPEERELLLSKTCEECWNVIVLGKTEEIA
jgi:hypothetical protein